MFLDVVVRYMEMDIVTTYQRLVIMMDPLGIRYPLMIPSSIAVWGTPSIYLVQAADCWYANLPVGATLFHLRTSVTRAMI